MIYFKIMMSIILTCCATAPAIAQEKSTPIRIAADTGSELENLKEQILQLQLQLDQQTNVPQKDAVDLSGEELPSLISDNSTSHVLSRPWFQNVDISGFGEFRYLDSGKDGKKPHGGFMFRHASLFVEAETWEDVSVFLEVSLNSSANTKVNEAYVHLRNILKPWGDNLLGIKAGRIDIPFGDEYLWNDSPDNPLISHTAAYPWLWDEGILLYGTIQSVGWVASITDGTDEINTEDDPAKAVTMKLYSTPWPPLYVSANFMKNGKTSKGAFYLGGSHFQPMGAGTGLAATSTAGASPSSMVDATLYEFNARYSLLDKAHVELSFGRGLIDDEVDAFDRNLTWFSVQPLYNLTRASYAIFRYSEIGTYNAAKGYHFGGEFLANGRNLGYDVKRLQRISAGLGLRLNGHTTLKVEAGRDQFELITPSVLNMAGDDRSFAGFELTTSF